MSRITGGSLLFVLYALGASGRAGGDAGVFRVDPDLTGARFAVLGLGLSKQEGRLGRTSGTIVFDAMHEIERVDLEIETASVATGWGPRDAFLRSELMFDAGRFPKLQFHSTGLRYDGTTLKGSDLQDAATKSGFDQSFAALVLFPDVVATMASQIECKSNSRRASIWCADTCSITASSLVRQTIRISVV